MVDENLATVLDPGDEPKRAERHGVVSHPDLE
jgi:hypothetical protein